MLINPNSGIGPSIVKGSKVKLAYQIKNAKTGAFIDETGKNNLPTDFEIGKPNIFGELLTTLVGANKGAKLQLTLPPEFGVQNPAAREFAKAHNLASDTILSIEFTVVDIVPAR